MGITCSTGRNAAGSDDLHNDQIVCESTEGHLSSVAPHSVRRRRSGANSAERRSSGATMSERRHSSNSTERRSNTNSNERNSTENYSQRHSSGRSSSTNSTTRGSRVTRSPRKPFFEGHAFRSSLGETTTPQNQDTKRTLLNGCAKQKTLEEPCSPSDVLAQVTLMKSEPTTPRRHFHHCTTTPQKQGSSTSSRRSLKSGKPSPRALHSGDDSVTSNELVGDIRATLLRNDAFA